MKDAPSVPELDDDSTPAVLKPLYATYRKSLAKLTADRDARTKPALEAHQKKLTAYQAQLTKAGDIPGALKVKDALAKLTNPRALAFPISSHAHRRSHHFQPWRQTARLGSRSRANPSTSAKPTPSRTLWKSSAKKAASWPCERMAA